MAHESLRVGGSGCQESTQIIVYCEIGCGLAFADLAIGAASQQLACEITVAALGGCGQRRESRFLVTVDIGASVEQQSRER